MGGPGPVIGGKTLRKRGAASWCACASTMSWSQPASRHFSPKQGGIKDAAAGQRVPPRFDFPNRDAYLFSLRQSGSEGPRQ